MMDSFQDLCSTCNYAPDCVLRVERTKPVHYCEEFDNIIYEAYDDQGEEVSTSNYAESRLGIDYSVSDYLEGLCCNCENRGTCIYQRPEGGVWHCREYR